MTKIAAFASLLAALTGCIKLPEEKSKESNAPEKTQPTTTTNSDPFTCDHQKFLANLDKLKLSFLLDMGSSGSVLA